MATAHIVGAQATLEWCSTGTMELLVIQELTLAVADIWASNTLVPLVRACVNAVVLSSSLLENKNKHATVKSHQVHKIHFTSNSTVTAVHPQHQSLPSCITLSIHLHPIPTTHLPKIHVIYSLISFSVFQAGVLQAFTTTVLYTIHVLPH